MCSKPYTEVNGFPVAKTKLRLTEIRALALTRNPLLPERGRENMENLAMDLSTPPLRRILLNNIASVLELDKLK